jgi:cold shock CspA family protein
VPTGTISWIDSARGCCFIASDLRGGDLYVDRAEIDCRSIGLRVGATVEFAVCTGARGRLVVTNVVAREPEQRTPTPDLAQTAAEVAADVWEGEGGALR